MSSWNTNFNELQAAAADSVKAPVASPRQRHREAIRTTAKAFKTRRTYRPGTFASVDRLRAEAAEALRRNYVSRRPDWKTLGALRATSRAGIPQLPVNAMNQIARTLYGPSAPKGKGPLLNHMSRHARTERFKRATPTSSLRRRRSLSQSKRPHPQSRKRSHSR